MAPARPAVLHAVVLPFVDLIYIYISYIYFSFNQSETLGLQPFEVRASEEDNEFLIAFLSISVSKVELVKAARSACGPPLIEGPLF